MERATATEFEAVQAFAADAADPAAPMWEVPDRPGEQRAAIFGGPAAAPPAAPPASAPAPEPVFDPEADLEDRFQAPPTNRDAWRGIETPGSASTLARRAGAGAAPSPQDEPVLIDLGAPSGVSPEPRGLRALLAGLTGRGRKGSGAPKPPKQSRKKGRQAADESPWAATDGDAGGTGPHAQSDAGRPGAGGRDGGRVDGRFDGRDGGSPAGDRVVDGGRAGGTDGTQTGEPNDVQAGGPNGVQAVGPGAAGMRAGSPGANGVNVGGPGAAGARGGEQSWPAPVPQHGPAFGGADVPSATGTETSRPGRTPDGVPFPGAAGATAFDSTADQRDLTDGPGHAAFGEWTDPSGRAGSGASGGSAGDAGAAGFAAFGPASPAGTSPAGTSEGTGFAAFGTPAPASPATGAPGTFASPADTAGSTASAGTSSPVDNPESSGGTRSWGSPASWPSTPTPFTPNAGTTAPAPVSWPDARTPEPPVAAAPSPPAPIPAQPVFAPEPPPFGADESGFDAGQPTSGTHVPAFGADSSALAGPEQRRSGAGTPVPGTGTPISGTGTPVSGTGSPGGAAPIWGTAALDTGRTDTGQDAGTSSEWFTHVEPRLSDPSAPSGPAWVETPKNTGETSQNWTELTLSAPSAPTSPAAPTSSGGPGTQAAPGIQAASGAPAVPSAPAVPVPGQSDRPVAWNEPTRNGPIWTSDAAPSAVREPQPWTEAQSQNGWAERPPVVDLWADPDGKSWITTKPATADTAAGTPAPDAPASSVPTSRIPSSQAPATPSTAPAPHISAPEAAAPGSTALRSTVSRASAAQSTGSQPGTAQPGTAQPGGAQPGAAQTNTAQTSAGQSTPLWATAPWAATTAGTAPETPATTVAGDSPAVSQVRDSPAGATPAAARRDEPATAPRDDAATARRDGPATTAPRRDEPAATSHRETAAAGPGWDEPAARDADDPYAMYRRPGAPADDDRTPSRHGVPDDGDQGWQEIPRPSWSDQPATDAWNTGPSWAGGSGRDTAADRGTRETPPGWDGRADRVAEEKPADRRIAGHDDRPDPTETTGRDQVPGHDRSQPAENGSWTAVPAPPPHLATPPSPGPDRPAPPGRRAGDRRRRDENARHGGEQSGAYPRDLVVEGDRPPVRKGKLLVTLTVAVIAVAVVGGLLTVLGNVTGLNLTAAGNGPHAISAPLDGRDALRFDLVSGVTSVTVTSDDLQGDLYRISTPEDSSLRPEVVDQGERVQLQMAGTGQSGPSLVEIRLSSEVAWDLRLTGGATEHVVDFSKGRVSGFDVLGGATRLELTLPAPKASVRLKISSGIGQFVLRTPSDTPSRLRFGAGADSVTLRGDGRGRAAPNSRFTPKAWEGAEDRYDIDIAAGVGTFSLEQ